VEWVEGGNVKKRKLSHKKYIFPRFTPIYLYGHESPRDTALDISHCVSRGDERIGRYCAIRVCNV